MGAVFQKAVREQSRARIALAGPASVDRTRLALVVASVLGARTALADSERDGSKKLADSFDFDRVSVGDNSPQRYIDLIRAAEDDGYDTIILDSLSQEWSGRGGVLHQVDDAARRNKGDSSRAWREAGPGHDDLVDAIFSSSIHVIATLRVKTECVVDKDESTGQAVTRRLALGPVQREGLVEDFDVFGDLDFDGVLVVGETTRCQSLRGKVFRSPGKPFAKAIRAWLLEGKPVPSIVTYLGQLAAAKTIDDAKAVTKEVGRVWTNAADPARVRFAEAYRRRAKDLAQPTIADAARVKLWSDEINGAQTEEALAGVEARVKDAGLPQAELLALSTLAAKQRKALRAPAAEAK